MNYTARHPETLGAALVLLGILGYVFRSKIAKWKAPPAATRMESLATRDFLESLTKWCSILLVFFGVAVSAIQWLISRP